MEPASLERALMEVAARAGVRVRCEPFDPRSFPDVDRRGGLCFVDGAALLLVDAALLPVERVAILTEALSLLELDAVPMPPAVRERLTLAGDRRADRRRRAIRQIK
ncbi:MAG: hypothetical protein IT374_17140 [Polyangiaceae bacterium]|nr:hypothetical protein [Polyangiaceae bacterium]